MLIKPPALQHAITKTRFAIIVLTGQEHFMLNESAVSIKKSWVGQSECETTILDINSPNDWLLLSEEANSYSLFSEKILLDVRFEKKAIDQSGKKILNDYLESINPHCLILIRASNVPAKQFQWITNHPLVLVVQFNPLSPSALSGWIASQLKHQGVRCDHQVPTLIHQYTQGNMGACAQVIQKLALISQNDEALSVAEVTEQLIDQCNYQLYELADACLNGNTEKAIHLLRQSHHQRVEPTLILWLFTQEIRLLIQLSHKLQQSIAFSTACAELKIWPQKTTLYKTTLNRLSSNTLYKLLQKSQELDGKIKSNQSNHVWDDFEQIALSLSLQH